MKNNLLAVLWLQVANVVRNYRKKFQDLCQSTEGFFTMPNKRKDGLAKNIGERVITKILAIRGSQHN